MHARMLISITPVTVFQLHKAITHMYIHNCIMHALISVNVTYYSTVDTMETCQCHSITQGLKLTF